MSQENIAAKYLADALRNFRSYKKLGEEALAQTSDEDIFNLIDPDANSIAMLIKHMAGNMRSRWTDFLTTDGETRPPSRSGIRNRSQCNPCGRDRVVGTGMAVRFSGSNSA
jgi:hypothetical protein